MDIGLYKCITSADVLQVDVIQRLLTWSWFCRNSYGSLEQLGLESYWFVKYIQPITTGLNKVKRLGFVKKGMFYFHL